MADGRVGTTTYRIGEAEQDIRDLQDYTRGVPERVTALERLVERLDGSITRLTMAIVGGAITVTASSIILALTVASH